LLIPEPYASLQRKLLESEGVKIVEFRVDFAKHGWAPRGAAKPITKRARTSSRRKKK
jgi:hypothetical protein